MAPTNKTLGELEAEIQALTREEDALRKRKYALKAAMDAKAADEQAERLLAGLQPGQVDAIASAAAARSKASANDAG